MLPGRARGLAVAAGLTLTGVLLMVPGSGCGAGSTRLEAPRHWAGPTITYRFVDSSSAVDVYGVLIAGALPLTEDQKNSVRAGFTLWGNVLVGHGKIEAIREVSPSDTTAKIDIVGCRQSDLGSGPFLSTWGNTQSRYRETSGTMERAIVRLVVVDDPGAFDVFPGNAAHEGGHALGFAGHLGVRGSLMSAVPKPTMSPRLTGADIAGLLRGYDSPAGPP